MCGRFTQHTPPQLLAAHFGAPAPASAPPPRYNIYPGSDILSCRIGAAGARELVALHWGLVPSWAKDPKSSYHMINARAETVAEKPAYRAAFRRRRCLIAADGFYEWKAGRPRKQPFFIGLRDGKPFAFAGLWEHWQHEEHVIESCTIIVTDANALVAPIHDRMPVILRPEDYAHWLDPAENDPAKLKPLLKSFPAEAMEAWAVSPRVNNPRNEGPELLAPMTD